jgi:pseudaminic acid cytidylyltransferase
MIAAIIPARGGSKRIPRKNVREFCGRPMIAWSIQAARKSGLFQRIIVSTDDREVSEVARQAGAEVPFIRPAELADDHTPTLPVIRHAVRWLEDHGEVVEAACCIYATAPFLRTEKLHNGLEVLHQFPGTDFVFAVTNFGFPIFRALRLDAGGRVAMFWPEHEKSRSQDLPEAFHDAGQFYWGTGVAWQKCAGLFSSRSRGLALPRTQVVDIDTEEDWRLAERIFLSRTVHE